MKRSRELLEAEIGNFLVVEHDARIVGCAALYAFPYALVEQAPGDSAWSALRLGMTSGVPIGF